MRNSWLFYIQEYLAEVEQGQWSYSWFECTEKCLRNAISPSIVIHRECILILSSDDAVGEKCLNTML